jgi:hypothetical protein
MGFLTTVVAFARRVVDGAEVPECSLDRDGDETVTAGHFGPPGDDSPPLPGDVAYLGDDAGSGAAQVVGYQDPETPPQAAPGDRRLYARSAPGAVAVSLWLKADGTLVVQNVGGGVLEIGADGAVRFGNALSAFGVGAGGVVFWETAIGTFGGATHVHTTPFGPSGPPIAGT